MVDNDCPNVKLWRRDQRRLQISRSRKVTVRSRKENVESELQNGKCGGSGRTWVVDDERTKRLKETGLLSQTCENGGQSTGEDRVSQASRTESSALHGLVFSDSPNFDESEFGTCLGDRISWTRAGF